MAEDKETIKEGTEWQPQAMEEEKKEETSKYLTLENGYLVLQNARTAKFGEGDNTIRIDNRQGFWMGNQIYGIAPVRISSSGSVTLESLKAAFYTKEYNNGNSGTGTIVNWQNGNKQMITLTGSGTITMIAPSGPANLILRLVQDVPSGRVMTWSPAVKWSGGSVLSTGSSAVDIATFYYNGTDYYGMLSLNFVT